MWHKDCPVDNCGIFWQAATLLSADTVGDRQIVTWDTILAQKLNAFTTAQTKEAESGGKICKKKLTRHFFAHMIMHHGESVTQTQILKIKYFWNLIFCHLNIVRV